MSDGPVQPNESVRFTLLYEDAHVAVIVKPAGLVTQPGKGHERDSLLNGLLARFDERLRRLGARRDYGLLHRLDRDTSGLLVVALTESAYDGLRRAFESRRVRKYYWAVVEGAPRRESGVIRRSIMEVLARPEGGGRGPAPMKLARISAGGKPALTAYRVLSSARGISLLDCRTLTGRLHQVRVHLASIGCPILGDSFYGTPAARSLARRLALHAHRLVLPHPSGDLLDCTAGWPADLRGLLRHAGLPPPHALQGATLRAPRPVDREQDVDDDGVGDEHPRVGQ